jgi:SPP1 family phage portal protein
MVKKYLADIVKELIIDYNTNLYNYQKMQYYYEGYHDILDNYKSEAFRSNTKTVVNYIQKFIEEELSYCFGNPLTYISKMGNKKVLDDIDYNLYHWQSTHNQNLMRNLEMFGRAYELYYINPQGEFCGMILNPSNAIAYVDADNKPQVFIHFYSLKYDTARYYDIYYSDRIEIYKNDILIDTRTHIFNEVPVSICDIGLEQTIYYKIKNLNDSLNLILSDQVNIISDYRNAYLVITGADVDEETALNLKNKGILNLKGKDLSVSWLIKNLDSSYIDNMLKEIKESMYNICNHTNSQDPLPSNTSGIALRSRLIFLEQRCKTVFDTVSDTIFDRIKFLFKLLSIKNIVYDWKDISISFSPCVPQDLISIAQVLTQLDGKISLETSLSLLPFIENPAQEIEKMRKETTESQQLNLDMITAV